MVMIINLNHTQVNFIAHTETKKTKIIYIIFFFEKKNILLFSFYSIIHENSG